MANNVTATPIGELHPMTEADGLVEVLLPAGTLIHVCGWPVYLTVDTLVDVNADNVKLIQVDLTEHTELLGKPQGHA